MELIKVKPMCPVPIPAEGKDKFKRRDLLKLVAQEGWSAEPKLDGYRGLVHYNDGRITWNTRSGKQHRSFPRFNIKLESVFRDTPSLRYVILDGELVCLNPNTGYVDFDLLDVVKREPDRYYIFDILYSGKDLTLLPLRERRKHLDELVASLPSHSSLTISTVARADVPETREILQQRIKAYSMEGIVYKHLQSKYGDQQRPWYKDISSAYDLLRQERRKRFARRRRG